MALIECPECKKEISDKAKTCPNCGHPINVAQKKSFKDRFRAGSIVGLIGGLGFSGLLLIALTGLAQTKNEEPLDFEITISPGGSELISNVAGVAGIVVTILFLLGVILAGRLSRKTALTLSGISLVLSFVWMVGSFIYFGMIAICGGWIFLWQPILGVVGATKMLTASLAYNNEK